MCRQSADRAELLRFFYEDGTVLCDERKGPKRLRGVHIHKQGNCLRNCVSEKLWRRALRIASDERFSVEQLRKVVEGFLSVHSEAQDSEVKVVTQKERTVVRMMPRRRLSDS